MGMLHLIVWVVIGLLALSFFGISLRSIANSPTNQDNLSFLMDTLRLGWGYVESWIALIAAEISRFGS